MKAKFATMIAVVKDFSAVTPKTFWFVSLMLLACSVIIFHAGAKDGVFVLGAFGFISLTAVVSVMALGFERHLMDSRQAWYRAMDEKHRAERLNK